MKRRRSNPTLLLILCIRSLCPTCASLMAAAHPFCIIPHCPSTSSLILLSPIIPHPSVHSFPSTRFSIHCIHPIVLYLLSIVHLFLHSPLFIHSPTSPIYLSSTHPPILPFLPVHSYITSLPAIPSVSTHLFIIPPVLHSSIHSPIIAPLFTSFSIQPEPCYFAEIVKLFTRRAFPHLCNEHQPLHYVLLCGKCFISLPPG